LEQRSPGTHRREIISATRKALATALQSEPRAYRDPGHLFGMIQDYGDASVAADLQASLGE